MAAETRYITTPIYYVNDKPHIGHVYTTAICDVYARFSRFAGHEVFFLTGTDEHATKVVEAAARRDLSAQQWADQNAAEFRRTFDRLGMSNDDFIRTSEDRHKTRVERYVTALLETGDIYPGEYEGWYDEGEEEYVPESRAREHDLKSPISGRPLVRRKEKNYFFRLSAYREQVAEVIRTGELVVAPEMRRNEILKRLEEAVDVPISRANPTDWGIRFPNDPEQTIYVWVDALFNYLTTVDTDERRHYWTSGAMHVIAKDILWFHAAIWPGLLLALRKCRAYEWVNLPREVYAHSFWISEGQKMSKSLGNFIDLAAIDRYLETYGLDVLRYYLTTQGPLGGQDADFAAAHFHEIYNTDLVNTVGNCASRVTAMISKYFEGHVPTESPHGPKLIIADHDWTAIASAAVAVSDQAMARFDLAGSVAVALGLIRRVDAFINLTEPFKLAKDEAKRDELGAILYQCLEAVRIASVLLWATLPERMTALWSALGLEIDPAAGQLMKLAEWGGLAPGSAVQKVALFPRLEPPAWALEAQELPT